MVAVTIRVVPQQVRDELVARVAREGQSLQKTHAVYRGVFSGRQASARP